MFKHAILLSALALAAPSWAINKCTGVDGKVVYQDAIDVRPASGHSARAPSPVSTPAPAQATAPAPAAPPVPAPAAPVKSAVELQADQCLAWYKPLLRDPASAYYSSPKFEDKRVLRMTLHATNGFRGVGTRMAACEFDNGKFSDDWTKIQARRLEWSVD